MRTRSLLVCALLLTVLAWTLAAAPASAAPPKLTWLAKALRTSPAYVDPAAHVPPAQARRLRRIASARRARVRLAVLSGVPAGAASEAATATALRARLHFSGAVAIAFVPRGFAVSAPNPAARGVVRARHAAAGKRGVPALVAFAVSLAAPKVVPKPKPKPARTTTAPGGKAGVTAGKGGGIPLWVWPIVAVVVLALAAAVLRTRSRAAQARGGGTLLAAAQRLAHERIATLGRRLTDTAVPVAERDDADITAHHRKAAEIVGTVRAELSRIDGPPGYRRANEALDQAEWHLGMAVAQLEGTAEPPRPEPGRPARCFFDAAHGLASVEVPLEVPGARTVNVGVCAEDAMRLSRGLEPAVGAVSVGRRTLPWAAAPTWFGGWGWGQDDLPALRYEGRPVFASGLTLEALARPAVPPAGGDPLAGSEPQRTREPDGAR